MFIRTIPANAFFSAAFLNQGITDAFSAPNAETGLFVRDEFSSGGGGGDPLSVHRVNISEKLLERCPVLADPHWSPMASVMEKRILESWTSGGQEPLEAVVERQVKHLRDRLEQLGDSPNACRLLNALKAVDGMKTTSDVEALSRFVLEPSTAAEVVERVLGAFSAEGLESADQSRNFMCLESLKRVVLSAPQAWIAPRVVKILSENGLSHPDDRVAQFAVGTLEGIASYGSKLVSLESLMEYVSEDDREKLKQGVLRFEGIQARYARLITADVVDRLLAAGLKSGRDFNVAWKALSALKTIALLIHETTSAQRAVEALYTEGLQDPNENVAGDAAVELEGIANKIPSRMPAAAVAALRARGLAPQVSQNLAYAALGALGSIVSPRGVVPSEERTVSQQALRALYEDGLVHPNQEVADMALQHLTAISEYRSDIITPDVVEALHTLFLKHPKNVNVRRALYRAAECRSELLTPELIQTLTRAIEDQGNAEGLTPHIRYALKYRTDLVTPRLLEFLDTARLIEEDGPFFGFTGDLVGLAEKRPDLMTADHVASFRIGLASERPYVRDMATKGLDAIAEKRPDLLPPAVP